MRLECEAAAGTQWDGDRRRDEKTECVLVWNVKSGAESGRDRDGADSTDTMVLNKSAGSRNKCE